MTARALVLAALADGPSAIHDPLSARDTTLMAAGLRTLGTLVTTDDDTRWEVTPRLLSGPARIDVGLSGTVMRFLPPAAALAQGRIDFDGDPHARQRPLGPLVGALRDLGVRIEAAPGGGLPVSVHAAGSVTGGEVVLDASSSSQFVSGLLLSAARYDRGVTVRHSGPPVPSAPHLRMTVQMLRAAGAAVDDGTPDVWRVASSALTGRSWQIEPDLSGAAPFFAAALVTGGAVTLSGWPAVSVQPIDTVRELFEALGATVTLDEDGLTVTGDGGVRGVDVDLSTVSELTPVVAALAALADGPSTLRGVAHIRGHETDRLAALARELDNLGATVKEHPDGLSIVPGHLSGGTFATYADHRMAHAAAVVGLRVPGVELDDVTCTSKTMPEFPTLWTAMVAPQ